MGDGLIADDGAGDELWETRDVHAEKQYVSLCGNLPSVNVDDVGKRLQGVKGDANGEREVEVRCEHRGKRVIDDTSEEAFILEKADDEQVEHDGNNENRPSPDSDARRIEKIRRIARPLPRRISGFSVEREGQHPVDHDRNDHEHDIDGLAPCVEEQRRDKKPDVLCLASRAQEIQCHEYGQKRKEKFGRRKDHGRQKRLGASRSFQVMVTGGEDYSALSFSSTFVALL